MVLTPMMQQYLQVKEKCKDCILFFRLGDFYEMFFEDAVTASRELELVLTGRDCGLEEKAPMCGVPFHAANSYIGRLVSKGYKIAICEQLEDPSTAKGIVKRDIIKIITPGTYMDSDFLEDNKNNFIMSLYIDYKTNIAGICFADISTGDFYCTDTNIQESVILDEISKYSPKEMLVQENIEEVLLQKINERFNILYTKKNDIFFYENSTKNLQKQFANFHMRQFSNSLINAANGLLNYILETQKINLCNIDSLEYYNIVDFLSIDINSRRNLELTESLRDKTKKGSLLWAIDKTCTAMGGRQLRKWIEQPLINKDKIEARLDAVDELTKNFSLQEDLRSSLSKIYDVERMVGKLASKSINAKELISLKNSIEKLPKLKDDLKYFNSPRLKYIYENLDELRDIYNLLNKAIMDNPAVSVKEGNIIKEGYNANVDELREAKSNGKEWIASLESREREVTGIKSLKVGYNKVFGYYIEITNANKAQIPAGRYIRKQTLANAERYITPELKEMEEKILGAEEKLNILEYELFVSIRDNIENQVDRIKETAKYIAELDCFCSLALVALEYNYCKPKIAQDGKIFIEEGRHPVVEKMISTGTFVANDTSIDNTEENLLLITGPNMAGKSTYMRQVALITIMAQIGSFVPAKTAHVSICDKVFTRIGASDDLSAGKSTFMVEMWEVSNILKNATNKSLVLLDEVGRGTSTYDGLSIAWAVIEHICNNTSIKCKTLFATHYHELTRLEGLISGVKNYSVAVKEVGKDIVFLRKIIRGGADQSYGIEVAKLAGLPEEVISRAKELLITFEQKGSLKDNKAEIFKIDTTVQNAKIRETAVSKEDKTLQLSFNDIEKENLIKDLKNLDVLNLTPMEGFNKLYEFIKRAKAL
ncbi:DNA mismatch repair protein MutS [Clostridium sp. SYSU_GA19001]|uniref:DNA mismatch repair protein MutS n=1 Tax=Clostridium caldaquaticum TaxID=2940653 RepID=UPI002077885F|nr:DNA mismatch repair protein MutS [Clostridium caldaquaticum]MCM8710657.1 DNA mismatch repair protein MutS [Clostridium caldaquaticum]